MSKENRKVCCNCRHCIRRRDEKYDMIVCRCEKYDKYLSYAEVMGSLCDAWEKEKEGNES